MLSILGADSFCVVFCYNASSPQGERILGYNSEGELQRPSLSLKFANFRTFSRLEIFWQLFWGERFGGDFFFGGGRFLFLCEPNFSHMVWQFHL